MSGTLDPLERLADSFEQIAKLLAQWYDKLYPPKQDARDVTLTQLPDTVDRIKQDQGASEETNEEWLTEVGPREREFLAQSSKTGVGLGTKRLEQKASRPRPIKG